ncbi:cysteine proteinase, partial [Neoconidiobolus thromboides FSU 785]
MPTCSRAPQKQMGHLKRANTSHHRNGYSTNISGLIRGTNPLGTEVSSKPIPELSINESSSRISNLEDYNKLLKEFNNSKSLSKSPEGKLRAKFSGRSHVSPSKFSSSSQMRNRDANSHYVNAAKPKTKPSLINQNKIYTNKQEYNKEILGPDSATDLNKIYQKITEPFDSTKPDNTEHKLKGVIISNESHRTEIDSKNHWIMYSVLVLKENMVLPILKVVSFENESLNNEPKRELTEVNFMAIEGDLVIKICYTENIIKIKDENKINVGLIFSSYKDMMSFLKGIEKVVLNFGVSIENYGINKLRNYSDISEAIKNILNPGISKSTSHKYPELSKESSPLSPNDDYLSRKNNSKSDDELPTTDKILQNSGPFLKDKMNTTFSSITRSYGLRRNQCNDIVDLDPDPIVNTDKKKPKNKLHFVYPFKGHNQVSIYTEDQRLLRPNTFLNDNVIEFYLRYILNQFEKYRPDLKDHVHSLSSFLYGKLSLFPNNPDEAFNSVKKWGRKIDFFKSKYLFIPINENFHWYIVIIGGLDRFEEYHELINRKEIDIQATNSETKDGFIPRLSSNLKPPGGSYIRSILAQLDSNKHSDIGTKKVESNSSLDILNKSKESDFSKAFRIQKNDHSNNLEIIIEEKSNIFQKSRDSEAIRKLESSPNGALNSESESKVESIDPNDNILSSDSGEFPYFNYDEESKIEDKILDSSNNFIDEKSKLRDRLQEALNEAQSVSGDESSNEDNLAENLIVKQADCLNKLENDLDTLINADIIALEREHPLKKVAFETVKDIEKFERKKYNKIEDILKTHNIKKEEERNEEIEKISPPWLAVFDSLGGKQLEAKKILREYIARQAKDRLNYELDTVLPWLFKKEVIPKVPLQKNFY